MTPLFPAQRAAEEFDSVLEGRANLDVAERYADMFATVQVLRERPEVTPRADFVADLRERLMLAAETDLVAAPPVLRRPPSRATRNRRLGTAAAALVIVGGSAGMAAAAESSLPGESLYPIKRGVEQVTIAANLGDSAKGAALLGQADERLDELQSLLAADASSTLVDSTVDDFRSSANSGADKLFLAYQADGDAADVTTVRNFTAEAMEQIDSLAADGNPAVSGALRDAADAIAEIDQQARILCSTCGGDALLPPEGLTAGAAAGAVANLISRPAENAQADIAAARAATAAAESERLGGLSERAQGVADELGQAKGGGLNGVTGPITSALTSTGQLVPSAVTTGGTAVTNLVGDLTGTVGGVVGGVTGAVDGVTGGGKGGSTGSGAGGTVGDKLDEVKKGAKKGVDDTVGGLTDDLLPQDD